jgi:hypothetical protein
MALFPLTAGACQCELSLSACNEVASSRVVFAGTVEAVEPRFLDGWNPAQRSAVGALNSVFEQARQQPSAATLERLKQSYLKTFPDLPEDGKRRIRDAKSPADFSGAFSWILEHGRTVRFRVRTLYRNIQDDDGGDDDAPDKAVSTMQIWTPFGDCGYNFQVGETYLVYATGDEESPVLSTSACSRTRRLSDAGEDLAYLFFYREQRASSSHLDGFVTGNSLYQRDYDPKHFTPSIAQPFAGVTVELRSAEGVRYAETDSGGRFTFDGLPSGEYTSTAWAAGYPEVKRALAGPKRVPIGAKACVDQVLLASP